MLWLEELLMFWMPMVAQQCEVGFSHRNAPPAFRAGLHSEQLALLDLLVLAVGDAFVGHPYSTMSLLVEQLRICAGQAANHYIHIPESEGNDKFLTDFVKFASDYAPLL